VGSIPFHLIGFSSNEEAAAAMDLISSVIAETSAQLGLDLRGLDGVTVAHDYGAALADLDRGVETGSALSATKDGLAEGVAMTPVVYRDGKVMSHLVMSAALLPTIGQSLLGVSGKYIVAHELAHVHEHFCRDQILPKTLLEPFSNSRDPVILFQMAEACWCEYVACLLSAPIWPQQAKLYEMTIVDMLQVVRARIIAAKLKWIQDQNFGAVLSEIATEAGTLLKYLSYLLGHAAGLDKTPAAIAPQAWTLLRTHTWLYPWVDKLEGVLRDMFANFENWTDMGAFDPLTDVARGLLVDCGITISLQPNKSMHVRVSPAKVW
jgi:hypothetical protein